MNRKVEEKSKSKQKIRRENTLRRHCDADSSFELLETAKVIYWTGEGTPAFQGAPTPLLLLQSRPVGVANFPSVETSR